MKDTKMLHRAEGKSSCDDSLWVHYYIPTPSNDECHLIHHSCKNIDPSWFNAWIPLGMVLALWLQCSFVCGFVIFPRLCASTSK